MEDNLIEKIAQNLALLHGDPPTGPCACLGISCGNLTCMSWWQT